jgi:hypothetical protein
MKMMGGKPKPPMAKGPKPPSKPMAEKPKEPQGKVAGEGGDGPGDALSSIHGHLQSMHEQTGNAHSHIEHHFDGHHTSHHISEHGEMSGPHEHPNTEALNAHMSSMGGDGMAPASGNAEVGNEPSHTMSGF